VTHAEAKAFAGDEAKKIKMTNNRKIVFDAAMPSVLTERTSHRRKLISLPRWSKATPECQSWLADSVFS